MKSRLPKGYGGGGAQNMQGLMKQAQKMQDLMAEKQEELNEREFSATVGGGAVSVTANGKKEILSLELQPDVVDPEDIEMLQDLVISAVNEVLREIETVSSEEIEQITGGVNMPGMF